MRYLLLALSFFVGASMACFAENVKNLDKEKGGSFSYQDSTKSGMSKSKSEIAKNGVRDTLKVKTFQSPKSLSVVPAVSLQQYLKGRFAGVDIQESSGEPGTLQNMFVRGAAVPLLNKKSLYDAQPLVVLDGIPLITEHPFAFDIQQYQDNRIGTATNIYSSIDMDNIASIEVLGNVEATAKYGPQAVNGVILLKTIAADTVKRVTFSTYFGIAPRPNVTTINGNYENQFRQRFYDIYTTNGRYSDDDVYPLYLSDSLSNRYFGASNWSDLYYRDASAYSVNASITGGNDRANFRFSLGNMQNQGVADETALNRYSTRFNINMRPVKWLQFSAMVNANRVERDRNRNLRDRYEQVNYFPDLSSPLSPDKEVYAEYLAQYDKGFDKNKTNIFNGYANLGVDLGAIKLNSNLSVDYNEGYRDIFYPRSLMQNTSYASNYYGFDQRFLFSNSATFDKRISNDYLHLELGQSFQWDTYKYNNAFAYKGSSDFIKINLLNSDPNRDDYLLPKAFPKELVFRYLDRTRSNLVSSFFNGSYSFNNKYTFSTVLRLDGSSNAQPTSRWFFSPTFSAGWNIKNDLLTKVDQISALNFKVGVGRIGRLNSYDNYSQGPQYMSNVGYTGNLTVPGYNAFAVLTRPYSFGWVGYGIPWSYSDQLNTQIAIGLFKNRLNIDATFYTKTEKNQLIGIPDGAEYGYSEFIKDGMSINNKGLEINIAGQVIRKSNLTWTSSLFFNVNKNRLLALPDNLTQLEVGDRLLKVGEPVDSYWLLENDGIYTADSDVPVANGVIRTFKGITLKAGDPNWSDLNNDNKIDNNDKVLQGHALPILVGGFDNSFQYKKWSLNFNFYYSLGRDIVNQNMANRFDFINREGQSNVNSVKEITYWEKTGDYNKYPLYNPWSTVLPYRTDQDLFLEDGSFVKLRTLSLGYDLTQIVKKKVKVRNIYVYGTVNNLFKITKYTGKDPELVSYDGYDTGYGMPIPKTFTLGLKLEL
ncbi:MAG TPA: SusC/RagA family TonB-linked outer membrane protein [Pelobium sp.]|nr:SusC/RagA family TonB-linked outer membrane protein [Pelobium sp.]